MGNTEPPGHPHPPPSAEESAAEDRSPPRRRGLVRNSLAGFVAGLYTIPEGIGYAQLAGVNPMLGVYSGMVPVAVGAAAAGSVLMITTLTSAIALTMNDVLQDSGLASDEYAQAVFTMALLAGVFMLLLGVFHLGRIVNYVSNSVMTGFVMGVALLIMVGKIDDIFGYSPERFSSTVVEAGDILIHPHYWSASTAMLGVGTILLAFGLMAVSVTRRFALILSVVAGTAVAWLLDLSTPVVSDVATIPSGLASLPIPTSTADLPDLTLIPQLWLGSLAIALVALAQGASIRPTFPNPSGPPARSSRDFTGQGLANLAGSLFQSTPTGGSLSRTAVSAEGGATSRAAGLFAALWLVILVVAFSALVGEIPEAVVGALLFVVGFEIFKGRLPDAKLAWRTGWRPRLLFVIALALTLAVPLQIAIIGTALLSLLVYAAESGGRGQLHTCLEDEDGWIWDLDVADTVPPGEVIVLAYTGPNFFGEIPAILEDLPEPQQGQPPGVVVLNLALMEHFTSTLVKGVLGYHRSLSSAGCGLVLCGLHDRPMQVLADTGAADELGQDNLVPVLRHVTRNLEHGRLRGERLLAELSAAGMA